MKPVASTKTRLKYAYRALQMNPATNAQQIIRQRQLALGLIETPSARGGNSQAPPAQSDAIRRRLEQIRAEFWTTDTPEFIASLDALAVDAFPVLKASVKRGKQLAGVKSQFEEFASGKKRNVNFLNTFKRLFLLAPREAGKVKEKYLRKLSDTPDLSHVKKTVRLLETKYPELYAVESDWLNQILKTKPRQSQTLDDDSTPVESDGIFGLSWATIITIAVVVVNVIVAVVRNWK